MQDGTSQYSSAWDIALQPAAADESIPDCYRSSDPDAVVKKPGDLLGQANATVGSGITWQYAGMHAHSTGAKPHKPAHGRAAINGSAGRGVDARADACAHHPASPRIDEVSVDVGAMIGILFQDRVVAGGVIPARLPEEIGESTAISS